MKKIYNYGNCVITVIVQNNSSNTVQKATETFLRKVVKENLNGNCNTTGNFDKK